MRPIYVSMGVNYVSIEYIYVDMRVNIQSIYVNMQYNYVNMQVIHKKMRDNFLFLKKKWFASAFTGRNTTDAGIRLNLKLYLLKY